MTKADLIERVAGRKGLIPRELTKKALAAIIDATFTELGDHFIRARVGHRPARFTYPGFGTFTKRRRNGRLVRNPRTGDPMPIPPSVTVVFAPGQELRKLLNDDVRTVRARRA
jgi:DNA-binding protein HU-beta